MWLILFFATGEGVQWTRSPRLNMPGRGDGPILLKEDLDAKHLPDLLIWRLVLQGDQFLRHIHALADYIRWIALDIHSLRWNSSTQW